jgi:hypothetical protein
LELAHPTPPFKEGVKMTSFIQMSINFLKDNYKETIGNEIRFVISNLKIAIIIELDDDNEDMKLIDMVDDVLRDIEKWRLKKEELTNEEIADWIFRLVKIKSYLYIKEELFWKE